MKRLVNLKMILCIHFIAETWLAFWLFLYALCYCSWISWNFFPPSEKFVISHLMLVAVLIVTSTRFRSLFHQKLTQVLPWWLWRKSQMWLIMMLVAARSRLRRCVKYVILFPCELAHTSSQLWTYFIYSLLYHFYRLLNFLCFTQKSLSSLVLTLQKASFAMVHLVLAKLFLQEL